MVTPAAKREAVAHLQTALGMSERRACAVVGADRTSMRYRSCREADGDLRSRLRELAQQRQRFGYRRLHILLRWDGITINRKRTQRLYREEGLTVRRRKGRKRAVGARAPAPLLALPNQRWSLDFVHDQMATRRRFRILNIVDDVMLDVLSVQWRVVRTVRPKYNCRACEKIVQAPAPPKAIARGKASFATLAHVVVNKLDHHLPLYRQAEMMAAPKGSGGIDIDPSMLAGWAGQAAALLDPIVARIREEGLKATKVHTDDTPVPMLDPGRGKTATARLWTYVVDDRTTDSTSPSLVWYRFTPDRSGVHPQTELKSFAGLLQADGYAGYDKLYDSGRICEVAC